MTSYLLNISAILLTVFAADTHLAEGQLSRQEYAVSDKSLKFRTGTRKPTVSSKEGQHCKPL
jgi:hypothetical protein